MTKQDKLDLAGGIADHTIDYIYETVASQLDWHDFNTDDEHDEDKFMEAHDEVMHLAIPVSYTHLTLPTNREG